MLYWIPCLLLLLIRNWWLFSHAHAKVFSKKFTFLITAIHRQQLYVIQNDTILKSEAVEIGQLENNSGVQFEGVVQIWSQGSFGNLWKNVHLQLFRDSEVSWSDQSGDPSTNGKVILRNVAQFFVVGSYTSNVPHRPVVPAGASLENLMAFPDYPSRDSKVNWVLFNSKPEFKQMMDSVAAVLPPPSQSGAPPGGAPPRHAAPPQQHAAPNLYPRQQYPVQAAPVGYQQQPPMYYASPQQPYYPAQPMYAQHPGVIPQQATGTNTIIYRDVHQQQNQQNNGLNDGFATGLIIGASMGWGYGWGYGCW